MNASLAYRLIREGSLFLSGALLILHALFPHVHSSEDDLQTVHISEPFALEWLHDLFDIDLGDTHLESFISSGSVLDIKVASFIVIDGLVPDLHSLANSTQEELSFLNSPSELFKEPPLYGADGHRGPPRIPA